MSNLPNQNDQFAFLRQQIFSLQSQVTRARQVALASKAELALMRAGRSPRFPIEFTSQYGEDSFAWQLLGYPLDGFFIEAGAFDGYQYSVTHALEAMGWTGLLVEALPNKAAQCRDRRTGSRVVHSALSKDGANGTMTFTATDDVYGGMFSYGQSTASHLDEIKSVPRSTLEVPVTSLNAILRDHHGPVDFMSIDVEGGELDVLRGFDFERFKPRLVMIEDNTFGRDQALTEFMSHQSYNLVMQLVVNRVYVRRDEAEILQRMQWLSLG